MGRELRRVPMDFDHPIGDTWPGYLSPDYRPCPSDDCDNGSTLAGAWLGSITHLILMLGEEGTSDRALHPWLAALPLGPQQKPGPQAAELTGGLAGRPQRSPFGHDAIDRWTATAAIVKAAGLPENWGTCPVCDGHAQHPDDQEAAEAWEPTEPPTGVGFQMWETTSEGSPNTPVFATLKELAEYCAANCTTFASMTASAEGWEQMLGDGMVSAAIAPGIIAL